MKKNRKLENYFTREDIPDLDKLREIKERTSESDVISAQFAGILDSLPFYVLLVDSKHHIQFANKAMRLSLGLSLEEITGRYCPEVVHGLDHPYEGCPVREAVKGQMFEKEHYAEELGCWLLLTAYPTGCKTKDGLDIFYHTVRDITDQKMAEQAIEDSEKKYRRLFEEIREIVFIISPEGDLQEINRSGRELLGLFSREDVAKTNLFRDVVLNSGEWDILRATIEQSGFVQDYEVSFKRMDGTDAVIAISASLEKDSEGQARVIRGIMHDMTRNRELEQQTCTDDLTRLFNHGFFQTYLVNKVSHMKSDGKNLSILFLDIDDFKEYNDTYGHQEGDKVLRKVAQAITQAARGEDVASRYGGEEFTLILDCDFETARQMAERLRMSIQDRCSTFADPDIKRSVTVSVGIASYDRDGDTAESLVKIADARMYQAKRLGKNQTYAGEVDLNDGKGHLHEA